MELKDIIQKIVTQTLDAMQPTDLRIGTVNSADPLEITINPAMAPLRRKVLYLTEAVVEKKIPILRHSHACPEGVTTDALLENDVICREDGDPLPVADGYIILNRALAVGDRVLLLRVQGGQRFVVLSRVFGEEVSV